MRSAPTKTKHRKSISAGPFEPSFGPWTLSGDTLEPILGRGPQKPQKNHNVSFPFGCQSGMYFHVFLIGYFSMLSEHIFYNLFGSRGHLGLHFKHFRVPCWRLCETKVQKWKLCSHAGGSIKIHLRRVSVCHLFRSLYTCPFWNSLFLAM